MKKNSKNSSFAEQVYREVSKISRGETRTYKQIAKAVGRPNAYRAVGSALSHNFDPQIPCHRVIRQDGKLGGYNRGLEKKRKILEQEAA